MDIADVAKTPETARGQFPTYASVMWSVQTIRNGRSS